MPNDLQSPAIDRTRYLGGSDVGALLGVSKWKTPLQLYLEKTGQSVEEIDPAKAKIFRRGKRMEPVVFEMMAEESGILAVARNQRYVDSEHEFLSCEIDGEAIIDAARINLEVKTSHPFAAGQWGEEGTDEMDVAYVAQAQHGLMVTGRNLCIFGVLVGADDLRTYRVERDDETIAAMRGREVAFWREHVLARVPPEPQTHDDLLRLFAKDTGRSVEADNEIAEAVNKLRAAKAAIKSLEFEAAEHELAVQSFMQDATTVTYGGKPLATWKAQQARRFSQREFSDAHPELFEQFKRVSESRVFRIK